MHQFNAAPLDKVWLRNGFSGAVVSGRAGVRYENVFALFAALLRAVVLKPRLLRGCEIAYLRRKLDLSQSQLGDALGVKEQTVSLWERDSHPIVKSADTVLRRLCFEAEPGTFAGNKGLTTRELAALAQERGEVMYVGMFEEKGGWKFEAKPIAVMAMDLGDAPPQERASEFFGEFLVLEEGQELATQVLLKAEVDSDVVDSGEHRIEGHAGFSLTSAGAAQAMVLKHGGRASIDRSLPRITVQTISNAQNSVVGAE
jgi:DNA-binding XRE family transcriptional regulator